MATWQLNFKFTVLSKQPAKGWGTQRYLDRVKVELASLL